MGTAQVRNINPLREAEEFCDFLWGEEEAFVHLPLKDPNDPNPRTAYKYDHFFKWPRDRRLVIEHIERYAETLDVFIAPGMFKERSSNVIHSHGSYVAWADFDGDVPSLEDLEASGVPTPTLRVQSSKSGHEHWYWRYTQFNSDIGSIQTINKSIAYALNADIGAWDPGHSTRPVGSKNHKDASDVLDVVIISANNYTYKIIDFDNVPVPQNSYTVEQWNKEHIPSFIDALMKHEWPDEARSLVKKANLKEGTRSSGLTALAYYAAEAGLDNSEMYAILQWKDKQWKKFYDRPDRERYYVDLINYARQKHPYQGIAEVTVLADGLQTYNFEEVVAYADNTEYLIDKLLPVKGTAYIVGRSGTGKTTLALGLATALALGKKYLDWEASDTTKRYKVLFLSLEMLLNQVNEFFAKLKLNFNDEELALLKENFHTYANPEKIKLYQPTSPLTGKFIRTLENLKPDILLIDSASFALASNLSNQEEVTKSIEFLDQIKEHYGCTAVFIHHSRKDPPGHGYKEADLDDVFGSTFIAASASTIVSLKQSKDYSDANRIMNIRYLKSRHSGDNTGFSATMDGEKRVFRRPAIGALPAGPSVPEQPTEKKTVKVKVNAKTSPGRSFFDI